MIIQFKYQKFDLIRFIFILMVLVVIFFVNLNCIVSKEEILEKSYNYLEYNNISYDKDVVEQESYLDKNIYDTILRRNTWYVYFCSSPERLLYINAFTGEIEIVMDHELDSFYIPEPSFSETRKIFSIVVILNFIIYFILEIFCANKLRILKKIMWVHLILAVWFFDFLQMIYITILLIIASLISVNLS